MPFKFLKSSENNLDSVITLGKYHPYRGGNNPEFDEFSGKILDLKKKDIVAYLYFHQLLKNYFNPQSTVVTIPSHDPNNINSGIKEFAEFLIIECKLIDGTNLLVRQVIIPQLAAGGNRNINIHMNSMAVYDNEKIKGKNILLIDDVCTSGNSLRAGKKLLEDAGANMVQMFALGQTTN